jgi:hypothetical protein
MVWTSMARIRDMRILGLIFWILVIIGIYTVSMGRR